MNKPLQQLEDLLRRTMGADQHALAPVAVHQQAARRMEALNIESLQDYAALVERSPEELGELVHELVVSETWFFRDETPFSYLQDYVRSEWLSAHRGETLRALSIPCATGEESYSLAMALLEVPLERKQFQVEAVDISRRALEHARRGLYNRHAFRGATNTPFMRHFQKTPQGYQLSEAVQGCVQYVQAGAVDFAERAQEGAYDVIFCRNLLIYLDAETRRRLVAGLDRLLRPGGLFVLGHAEAPCVFLPQYETVPVPGAFAARKPVSPRPASARSALSLPRVEPLRVSSPAVHPPVVPAPLKVEPKKAADPATLLLHARASADKGEYGEARKLCSELLKKIPACAEAYYLLGVVALAEGHAQKAVELFQKTLYLEPDNLQAAVQLDLLSNKAGAPVRTERYRRMADRIARGEGVAG